MEEERIKDFFHGYDPELSSGIAFMERLERNLDAVEMIHRENEAAMKRNRIAVAVAAAAGFITGVVFTLIFPYIKALIQSMMATVLTEFRLSDNLQCEYVMTVSWLLIGGISVLVALNTYNLTLACRASRCSSTAEQLRRSS